MSSRSIRRRWSRWKIIKVVENLRVEMKTQVMKTTMMETTITMTMKTTQKIKIMIMKTATMMTTMTMRRMRTAITMKTLMIMMAVIIIVG